MDVPKGFFATLWNLLGFLLFFALLLVIGITKAIIFSPVVLLIIAIGNSAIIVGLWPVHLIWTSYCIAKAKQLGLALKIILLVALPVPLILWLGLGIIGSIFVGIGYGILAPLMATFESSGEGRSEFKLCFIRGTWRTILGSCTVVRDFKDVCYYSYFSAVADIDNLPPKSGKPLDIKLLYIPGCILVGLLGIIVDVPIITILAFCKAPFMLFKGWQRLLQDLIGRAGPFLETPCVPFAGLCILLWPLVVACAVLSAVLSSFFLGIYGAAVVYEETSVQRGLAYIIAAIALFDEYSNDLLYMRQGSCFPRPKYRKECTSVVIPPRPVGPIQKKPPLRILSFQDTWYDLKSVQVWDNLFQACELCGQRLIQTGAISVYDLQQWKHSDSRILNIGLPAYVLLQCFLRSIKDGATGFRMLNGRELTEANRPEGRVFEWFFEPMTIMKEQLRALQLQESEELYLYQLVLNVGDSKCTKTWDNGGIPPADEIRRAELQALARRLQGHCATLSRMPTFRRRFHDVVKAVIQEAPDIPESSQSDQSGHIGIHVKPQPMQTVQLKPILEM